MAKKIIRRKGSERSWMREVGYGKPPQWYLEDDVIDEDEEDFKRQEQQIEDILAEEDIDEDKE